MRADCPCQSMLIKASTLEGVKVKPFYLFYRTLYHWYFLGSDLVDNNTAAMVNYTQGKINVSSIS